MHVAIFSMGPVFPEAVHGGSQKTLRELAIALGHHGHTCRIFCTRRADNNSNFDLSPQVRVLPVLEFKESYPEPYYTAPYRLRNVITDLRFALDWADVFYIHDGELMYHFLYDSIPTAMSVRDFVYPDTLAGALSFQRDRLIVASDYIRSCVEATFEDFCAIETADLIVIPNGFDSLSYRRRDASAMRQWLGLADDHIAILYPHRPDPRKGLYEAIQTVARLRALIPTNTFERIRLLVPRWVDSNLQQSGTHVYQSIYSEAQAYAANHGMPHLMITHPWVPLGQMPEYYSAGAVTLCIGSFVEAFGNVSLESELCGTPAVISRVGAQRSILPDDLTYKVDYTDIDGVAARIAEIVRNRPPRSATRDFIARNFSQEACAAGYVEAISSTTIRTRLPQRALPQNCLSDTYDIPPWCALLNAGYYNDYDYGYSTDERLVTLLRARAFPARHHELISNGVRIEELDAWTRAGLLRRRAYRGAVA